MLVFFGKVSTGGALITSIYLWNLIYETTNWIYVKISACVYAHARTIHAEAVRAFCSVYNTFKVVNRKPRILYTSIYTSFFFFIQTRHALTISSSSCFYLFYYFYINVLHTTEIKGKLFYRKLVRCTFFFLLISRPINCRLYTATETEDGRLIKEVLYLVNK